MRVWEEGAVVQTLYLPAISCWSEHHLVRRIYFLPFLCLYIGLLAREILECDGNIVSGGISILVQTLYLTLHKNHTHTPAL